jgi:hypothetical protein
LVQVVLVNQTVATLYFLLSPLLVVVQAVKMQLLV